MTLNAKNRWIVLINKSPKGPLTKEDIDTLLEKKVIRGNDIAYLLPVEGEGKTTTEWKLLWQFPEFNRRVEPTFSPEKERRETPPAEPTLGIAETLPQDLREISVEELIPRTTRWEVTGEGALPSTTPPTEAETSFLSRTRLAVSTGLLSGLCLLAWAFLSQTPSLESSSPSADRRTASAPAVSARPVLPTASAPVRTAVRDQKPVTTPAPPASSPRTPGPEVSREAERGEIPLPDEEDEFDAGDERKPRMAAKARKSRLPKAYQGATRAMGSLDEGEVDDEGNELGAEALGDEGDYPAESEE